MMIFHESKYDGSYEDITPLVTSASWKTVRVGSPATLEISMLKHKAVQMGLGDILLLRDEKKGYFYGYVFRIKIDEKDELSITAYDQMRYLKNKQTYTFQNKRADQIASQIFADFQLQTGPLANTGYVIPSMVEDSSTLLDIILKALDQTLIHTSQMFYLWDDYGALRISDMKQEKLPLIVGDSSLATGFSYQTDIDGDTANFICLVQENKEEGKRTPVLLKDETNMQRWGVLQHFETVDENMDAAQVKQQAEHLLYLKNRPARSFDLDALADYEVRAGKQIMVQIGSLGVRNYFIVDECTHDLLAKTMQLKLLIY